MRSQLSLRKVLSDNAMLGGSRALVWAIIIIAVFAYAAVVPSSVLAADENNKTKTAKEAKNNDKPVTVHSDTMESLRSEGVVIFRGNVVAEQDHLMCSDELHVFYDKSQQVRNIVAIGNARIVQEGSRARGDKIVYDKAGGELIITGNAAAMQCGDIVRGEKIIFYLDSDNVMVEGGDKRVRAVIIPQKENKECSGEGSSGAQGHISEEFQCQRAR